MEQRQFDALTRALGGGLSRRGLGMLAGALVVAAPAGLDARKKKKKCQDGLTTCKVKLGKKKKTLCVDALTDSSNCGACGQLCANNQTCVGGSCVSSPPSPPPPPAQPCNASTCPNGCCDGSGVCRSGTSNAVCGKGGGICAGCSGQAACIGGSCVCQPATCAAIGNVCGPQADGCGGILTCTCAAGSLCQANGTCQACDVCANGCTHNSIQEAVNAANAGDTIRICAGVYTAGSGTIVTLGKNLTLIGAGTGFSGTRIHGNGDLRDSALVQVNGGVTAELRDLEILGAVRITNGDKGAGIQNSGSLTLTRASVIGGETAVNGGGIWTEGTLILNAGSSIGTNFAVQKGGGIYQAGGAVTLNAGCSVAGNGTDAAGGGGGIWSDGVLNIDPGATLSNNTANHVTNNCAGSGCP